MSYTDARYPDHQPSPQPPRYPAARPPRRPPARPPLRPALILLLALLPLIVGLSRHIGLSQALGPAGGALLLVALVTAIWMAVVGWGRVPRPVATLTLAGLAAGCYLVALRTVMFVVEPDEPLILVTSIIPLLLSQTLWGLMAGGLALAVQQLRGQQT